MQIDLNGKTYKQIFVDTEKKFGNFSLQLEPPLKVLEYDKSIDLVAHQRIYVGGGGGGGGRYLLRNSTPCRPKGILLLRAFARGKRIQNQNSFPHIPKIRTKQSVQDIEISLHF